MLQDEGVDFITLHPRTAKMGFRRTADWSVIARLKEKTSMPVIGNGDIHSAETALQRLQSSGCDGVMIGREAVKSPWIFLRCQNLQQGTHKMLEINVRDVWNKTLDAMKEYLPEHLHRSRSHRFCLYYSRNVTYGHGLFTKIRKEGSIDAIQRIVDEYFVRNEHEKVIRAGT